MSSNSKVKYNWLDVKLAPDLKNKATGGTASIIIIKFPFSGSMTSTTMGTPFSPLVFC